MTKVLVGCPIKKRDWILWDWLSYVEKAAQVADVEVSYVFVVSPFDDGTLEIINSLENATVLYSTETEKNVEDVRVWNIDRFDHMVNLRNQVLREVRIQEPDYFLSLDSDILIHPDCLANLIESSETYDAVGGKTYMSPTGTWCVSWCKIVGNGGMMRVEFNEVRQVDVIMGIKLMNPKAYAVDYQPHYQGEDLGWSKAAKLYGIKIAGDGRVASKHVMGPSLLKKIDERCGY